MSTTPRLSGRIPELDGIRGLLSHWSHDPSTAPRKERDTSVGMTGKEKTREPHAGTAYGEAIGQTWS